jgi:hypothetical protein
MLFLKANSQVRSPTVYAVFRHNEINYLIMEFIEGEELSTETWLGLSDDGRTKLLSRLCEQFRLLRAIPSPGYYGRVYHQGWRRICRLFHGRQDKMCGPYDNYRDLLSASIDTLHVLSVLGYESPEFLSNEPEHIAQVESTLATCSGLEPTFTHLDPAMNNIIRPIRDGEDWEVTWIDWEDSGWLPAYMQVVAIRNKLFLARGYEDLREETNQMMGKVYESFPESYTKQLEIFLFLLEYFGYAPI